MEYRKSVVSLTQQAFEYIEKKYGFTEKVAKDASWIVYTNSCCQVILYVGREIEFEIKWRRHRPCIRLEDDHVAQTVGKEYRGMISDEASIQLVVVQAAEIIEAFLARYYEDSAIRALRRRYDEEESLLKKEAFENNLIAQMDALWREGRYFDFVQAYKKLRHTPSKCLQKKYEYATSRLENSSIDI